MRPDLTPNQEKLLKQIIERKDGERQVICLHALGQPLVDELCTIIINFQEQLDHHNDIGRELDLLD